MKKYIFTLIILFTFLHCQEKEESGIFVDLDTQTTISLLDIFSDIEIIPLETTDKSLINNITKVISLGDKYYIFDKKQNKIFLFDQDGRFLNEINDIGSGPEEYIDISDFDINDQIITLLAPLNRALYNYNMSGTFIKKTQLPKIKYAYTYLNYINADTIAFWTFDTPNQLKLYSKKENKIFKDDYTEERDQRSMYLFATFPYHNRFCRFGNEVYMFDSESNLKIDYKWDFGKYNTDPKLKLEPQNRPSVQEIHEFASKIMSSEIVNYIFMAHGASKKYLYTQIGRKNQIFNIFHDKESLENIIFAETKEKAKFRPVYWSDDFVIGLSTGEGIDKIDEVAPNSVLDEVNIAKKNKITEEDNPILIKYKFK